MNQILKITFKIERVGIIGQPLKLFNIKTLAVRGNNEKYVDCECNLLNRK